MANYQARCELLTKENEELRERITQLEEILGANFDAPPMFALTGSEARLFGLLMARDLVTKESAMSILYGLRPDNDGDVEIKIIDVFIYKMRKKLEEWEIKIETVWGRGYYIAPDEKERISALIESRKGVAA